MAAPGFRKPPIIIEPQIIEIHKPEPKRNPYGQKIETAQRRQRSNIFGLGQVLHNKLAVDA
jgi:hypothetical protein